MSLFSGWLPGSRTVGVEENDCVQEEVSKPQRSLLPSTLCEAPRPHVPAIGSASGETDRKEADPRLRTAVAPEEETAHR